ncbi:MAG: hypothetical protein ACK587_00715 [Cyanobacteriota bacterium]
MIQKVEHFKNTNTLAKYFLAHKPLQKEYLIEVILLSISIVYGVLDAFINNSPKSNTIFKVLVIGLLLQICYKVLLLPSYIKLINIENHLGQISDNAIKSNQISMLLSKHMSEGCFRHLVYDLNHEINNILYVEENAIIIKHTDIAISSYLDFWTKLIDMQKRYNHRNNITVQCIHAFDMKMYDDKTNRQAEILLNLQKKFIESNGKVQRILCGNSKDLDDDIKKVAIAMKRINIEVFYYNLGSNYIKDYTGNWDFAHVLETKDAYIWNGYNKHDNKVVSATLIGNGKYEGKDLFHLWEDIKENSSRIENGEL